MNSIPLQKQITRIFIIKLQILNRQRRNINDKSLRQTR
jgi:hypothetical protein